MVRIGDRHAMIILSEIVPTAAGVGTCVVCTIRDGSIRKPYRRTSAPVVEPIVVKCLFSTWAVYFINVLQKNIKILSVVHSSFHFLKRI